VALRTLTPPRCWRATPSAFTPSFDSHESPHWPVALPQRCLPLARQVAAIATNLPCARTERRVERHAAHPDRRPPPPRHPTSGRADTATRPAPTSALPVPKGHPAARPCWYHPTLRMCRGGLGCGRQPPWPRCRRPQPPSGGEGQERRARPAPAPGRKPPGEDLPGVAPGRPGDARATGQARAVRWRNSGGRSHQDQPAPATAPGASGLRSRRRRGATRRQRSGAPGEQ
jgi:hypothetical protein